MKPAIEWLREVVQAVNAAPRVGPGIRRGDDLRALIRRIQDDARSDCNPAAVLALKLERDCLTEQVKELQKIKPINSGWTR